MSHKLFQAEAAYSDALADLENIRRENISDDDLVLDYLSTSPDAPLRQISRDLGIKAGSHKQPLNQILIRLRDAGKVTVSDNQWGEPRFSIK